MSNAGRESERERKREKKKERRAFVNLARAINSMQYIFLPLTSGPGVVKYRTAAKFYSIIRTLFFISPPSLRGGIPGISGGVLLLIMKIFNLVEVRRSRL